VCAVDVAFASLDCEWRGSEYSSFSNAKKTRTLLFEMRIFKIKENIVIHVSGVNVASC